MSATPAPAASAAIPNPDHVLRLAAELNVKVFQVAATAQLLAEGATVPFIPVSRNRITRRYPTVVARFSSKLALLFHAVPDA